jgi:uncharacterized flavoprotein (TIGR03862 family)
VKAAESLHHCAVPCGANTPTVVGPEQSRMMEHNAPTRPHVVIIGGGPSALIAADGLADVAEVDLYERGHVLGRKFLVAGDGGLNITNSAEEDHLLQQFAPPGFMDRMIAAWGPAQLRAWLAELGVPTFVGSSGRVFPVKGITPAEVLKAITQRVRNKGVRVHLRHTFVGFDHQRRPIVDHQGVRRSLTADAFLFALGGASWPRTGSVGEWTEAFRAIGVRTVPFRPSNCGVLIAMTEGLSVHEGKPLKNIRITCGPRSVRGEATITRNGLEGQAVYPLVPEVRRQLDERGMAELLIDLKPDVPLLEMERRLRTASAKERTHALRLDRQALALLKAFTPRERFLDPADLAADAKHLRIPVPGLRPLEEAISSVGGIALEEVAIDLGLKQLPTMFVAGEMLDVDAPTGGFLLQGAFSMGHWAAQGMLRCLSGSSIDSPGFRAGWSDRPFP